MKNGTHKRVVGKRTKKKIQVKVIFAVVKQLKQLQRNSDGEIISVRGKRDLTGHDLRDTGRWKQDWFEFSVYTLYMKIIIKVFIEHPKQTFEFTRIRG